VIRLAKNWPEILLALHRGRRLSRVRLRGGLDLACPPELDMAFLFNEIWVQRTYSANSHAIAAGWNVVDVGANVGVFAALAASSHPTVHVIACEPHPGNAAWLRRNLHTSRLGNVVAKEIAVAATAQPRTFYAHPTNWLVHSLHSVSDTVTRAVVCQTLEQQLAEFPDATCDLLKLDCEGSEHEILEACGEGTLRRVLRIVAEFHPLPDGRDGETLVRLLARSGYRIDRVVRWSGGTGLVAATRGDARPGRRV
jgi:FkbM family methyltransferase